MMKKKRVMHPKHLNPIELMEFETVFKESSAHALGYMFKNYNMSMAQCIAFVEDYKTWNNRK